MNFITNSTEPAAAKAKGETMNNQLTKGDYQVANRVLFGGAVSPAQFQKDAQIAQANGLVEFTFDVDGGYYTATDKFNELAAQFN